jgi:hypothetical protein
MRISRPCVVNFEWVWVWDVRGRRVRGWGEKREGEASDAKHWERREEGRAKG